MATFCPAPTARHRFSPVKVTGGGRRSKQRTDIRLPTNGQHTATALILKLDYIVFYHRLVKNNIKNIDSMWQDLKLIRLPVYENIQPNQMSLLLSTLNLRY